MGVPVIPGTPVASSSKFHRARRPVVHAAERSEALVRTDEVYLMQHQPDVTAPNV